VEAAVVAIIATNREGVGEEARITEAVALDAMAVAVATPVAADVRE
jgi:hypothetical protein